MIANIAYLTAGALGATLLWLGSRWWRTKLRRRQVIYVMLDLTKAHSHLSTEQFQALMPGVPLRLIKRILQAHTRHLGHTAQARPYAYWEQIGYVDADVYRLLQHGERALSSQEANVVLRGALSSLK